MDMSYDQYLMHLKTTDSLQYFQMFIRFVEAYDQ